MSVFNFAYTVPFPKDSKITWAQAFEGLRFKARDPLRFVPLIAACEVYEETPTYIKRKVSLKTGTEMVEDVSLHEPSLVVFKSNTGFFVNNLISENSDGALFLTFTFSMPLQGVEPGTEAEVAKRGEMKKICVGAVEQSLKTTLELLEEGKLN